MLINTKRNTCYKSFFVILFLSAVEIRESNQSASQSKRAEGFQLGVHPARDKRSGWNNFSEFMELPERPKSLDDIEIVDPHAERVFRANESLLHFRTENWMLSFDDCLEVRFRIEGKRTRLMMYTCEMAPGGLCIMDRFLVPSSLYKKKFNKRQGEKIGVNGAGIFWGREPKEIKELIGCHKLQPWFWGARPFAFHFRFVRRARKFADLFGEWRHKNGQNRSWKSSTREVGRVVLKGFHRCDRACRSEPKDGEIAVQRQAIQYMGHI